MKAMKADNPTMRDLLAIHAPPPHWAFMQDSRPAPYETAKDWTLDGQEAADREFVAWEQTREIAWRWHWADLMLAARESGQ
jgi:hypothetical protein